MHDTPISLSKYPLDFRANLVLHPPILLRDNPRSLLLLLRSFPPFDPGFVDQESVVEDVEIVIQDAHDVTLKLLKIMQYASKTVILFWYTLVGSVNFPVL